MEKTKYKCYCAYCGHKWTTDTAFVWRCALCGDNNIQRAKIEGDGDGDGSDCYGYNEPGGS